MPRQYVGTVRNKATDSPSYVKKGGGLTPNINEARLFSRKYGTGTKRLIGAMTAARNQAEAGQLYDAEEHKD